MPIYKIDSKKDGKQGYRVRVNYVDNMGNSKQLERRTYGSNEAKQLEKEMLHNLKEEAQNKTMTLQELYEEYIKVKKYEVREATLDKTQRVLEYHVLPYLKSIRITKLTLPVLQKWKLNIEEKNSKGRADQKLSLTTKKNIFREFRTLLNYAVKMEYITKNPLTSLGNFKSSDEPKKEMDFYTADEFIKFIKAACKCAQKAEKSNSISEWGYYVFFAIAFYTGLRKGEINALQWNDISGTFLSVNRSISQKVKGDDRETPPKNTSSIRTLQIPKPLMDILKEHKERCTHIDGFTNSYRVCGGTKPLRDTTIQIRNKKYAELAGIKTIRIHDFRHSHVSLLANEGINIQEIARRLGHSKVEITWNTYSHLYPREEERAIDILDKIK